MLEMESGYIKNPYKRDIDIILIFITATLIIVFLLNLIIKDYEIFINILFVFSFFVFSTMGIYIDDVEDDK